ncbi:MAG: hypothetical protein ABID38_07070 [Candidatus Diapherotrites archaeon]
MQIEKLLDNKMFIISLFLLLSVSVTLPNHLNYPLPLHADEYDNLALANETVSKGMVTTYDPYAPGPEKSIYNNIDEPPVLTMVLAYEVFLSIPIMLANFGTTETIILFPILMSFLLLISTFLLVEQLFKNRLAAIISSVFVLFTTANPTILGYQLVVASSLGLALLPFLFYLLLKAISSKKYFLLFFAFLIFSSFFYPITTTIVLFASSIFLILNPKILFEKWKEIFAGMAVFAIVVLLEIFALIASFSSTSLLALLQEHGPVALIAILDGLIQNLNFFNISPLYNLANGAIPQDYITLPIAVLFLAALIAAIYITLKKQKFSKKNPNHLLILPISFLLLIASLLIFSLSEINLPFLLRRGLLFLFYLTSLLSGITFWIIYKYFAKKFPGKIVPIVAVAIILISLSYFPFAAGDHFYRNIEPEQLPVIDWINENTPENTLILSTPYLSKPINVLTGRKVVCTNETKVGCRPEHVLNNINYFLSDCQTQEKILTKYYQADFIVKPKSIELVSGTMDLPELNCSFLQERFSVESTKIYEVNLDCGPDELASPIISGCG